MKPQLLKSAAALSAAFALTGPAVAQQPERIIKHGGNQVPTAAAMAEYKRSPYYNTELALNCVGFYGVAPIYNAQINKYEPHAAVKHANDVDAPVRGRGQKLCDYVKVPQNRQWYKDRFGIW